MKKTEPKIQKTLNNCIQRENRNPTGHHLLKLKSSVCWKTEYQGNNFVRFNSIFDPWSPDPKLRFSENNLFTLIKTENVRNPRRIGDKIEDYEFHLVKNFDQIDQLVKTKKYRQWLFEN